MAVDIGVMRLRGPPGEAVMTRFLLEDGIRTGWPDEARLVLIRRLVVPAPRRDVHPAARQAALRAAYERAERTAPHGGALAAGDAGAVWFDSPAEAVTLLLRELAAGRTPLGWHWPMAVPGWQAGSVPEVWLGTLLRQTIAGEGPIGLVALATAVEAAGATALLFEAAARIGGAASPMPAPARDPAPAAPVPEGEAETLRTALAAHFATLPAALVTLAERLPADQPVAVRLVEQMLLRACPGLRLAPRHHAALVRQWRALRAARLPIVPEPATAPPAPMAPAPSPLADVAEARLPAPARPSAEMRSAHRGPSSLARADPVDTPHAIPAGERFSRGAGLWQVVPALIRLGFREWLLDHPAIAAADGGRRLLRHIGLRYRLLPDDPAMLPLGEPAPPLGFETAWRVGLDRYLRRRARIRLAELVHRPGWIRADEERVLVRFPPEAADLRLRRRALDVDPGWTDWLGVSLRYLYAEASER